MIEQDFENPRLWEIPKPFLIDFFVPYSVYDSTFHQWKMTSDPAPLDPCCTSCRVADDHLMLCVYVGDESYQPALDSLIEQAAEIESALKVKLGALHQRYLAQHEEENLPGMPDWQRHWAFLLSELGEEPEAQIPRMYKLTGISLVRCDPAGEYLAGYEFQTAWDMDHGIEILMRGSHVLASGAMLELTSTGGAVLDRAKATQAFFMDPGDLPLN